MENKYIWAAGFMDGEGTFTIKRSKYKKTDKLYYFPTISCSQTIKGEAPIILLKELFGGSLYRYRQKGQRLDTIQWQIASRKALECAKKLHKHLILKNKQAELIIQFFGKTKPHTYHKLTYEIDEIRAKMFSDMRKLNVKGKLRLQRLNEMTPNGDATV